MLLSDGAARAFKSFWTPGVFVVILQTILLTLLCLFGFVMGTSWLAFHIAQGYGSSWIGNSIRVGGSVGSFIIAWLLFPGIMPVVVSFFDDKIARVIEDHEYVHAPKLQPVAFWPEVLHDIGFSVKAVLLNIICLPLYIVPGIGAIVFYMLNGYLLGREFFVMVARRHMARADAEKLRRNYRGTIFMGGVLLTLLATVPFVNLIAPFWGVALAVHLFHQVFERQIVIEAPKADGSYGRV